MASPTDVATKIADPLLNSGSMVIAALLLLSLVLFVFNVVQYRDGRDTRLYLRSVQQKMIATLNELRTSIEAVLKSRGP